MLARARVLAQSWAPLVRLVLALVIFVLQEGSAVSLTFSDAVAIHQSGDLERAWSSYEALLAAEPTGEPAALVLHNMATILHARGELSAAAELIERAIAQNPGEASYRNTLGVVQRSAGDLGAAVASFEAAVAALPEMHTAHLNLANTLHFYIADNPVVVAGPFEERRRILESAVAHYMAVLKIDTSRGGGLGGPGGVHGGVMSIGERVALLNDCAIAQQKLEANHDAVESLREAAALNPRDLQSVGNLVMRDDEGGGQPQS